ncbi:2-hydroxychromene-2-carboxylate isomerase [Noviherbaspirillum humi]|uniref:2-hydroxychromene-2-carboxylate isomerase n=1 Tax=Noviherbaspirillum humi TaxID=1688639 RepID=A0A239BUB9_9BURK|nr:2-hydroxychromene-2-carboxylate isomerase [Noviherbaspirillum humi]SNS11018.1 2-hydroxychromene-2-carboxylate isomerase [Noviherbaspirillum humi]
MKKQVDWYFDFISPFSYLQAELLHTLDGEADIACRPLLFAGLLNHWDFRGPAEIGPKRTWTYEHCAWLAHRHGIPITMPPHHPFNPLPLLRLCAALGSTREAVLRLFRFVWRDGRLPADESAWQELLQEMRVEPARLEAPEVKQALRANGDAAIAAGVFGVPTAVVDNRIFWGLDATDMLQAWLRGDAFFDSPAFIEAARVQPGQQRQPKPSA